MGLNNRLDLIHFPLDQAFELVTPLGGEFKNKERRRASLDNLIRSPLGL